AENDVLAVPQRCLCERAIVAVAREVKEQRDTAGADGAVKHVTNGFRRKIVVERQRDFVVCALRLYLCGGGTLQQNSNRVSRVVLYFRKRFVTRLVSFAFGEHTLERALGVLREVSGHVLI